MGRLSNKVAIITGGSQGMGEATVRQFVEAGAKVMIADILDDKGQALADSLGENAIFQHLDVSSKKEWKAAVEKAESHFGSVSVLVNNAGILHVGSLVDTTEEDYMRVIRINQLGPFLGMQAVVDAMKRAGSGSIVNISSFEGLQAKNGLSAYVSSKWAVRGMTKSAAIELGRYKIRVNSVHPGGIHTPMSGATTAEPSEQANAMYAKHPIPRVGMPDEVAAVSLFLATDEASYTTGSEIVADGGWNAGLMLDLLPCS
jgi:3alpha(or 20beta)-hydroxysteroid dehydrogenase